ncbi:geranylgeranyl pyrophosphate synthetase [Podospora conica]|nr:geranylgeranyl pyrophosphate synthetase [Schizothecium conicum]
MTTCHCQRQFGSEEALMQHQAAKHGVQPESAAPPSPSPPRAQQEPKAPTQTTPASSTKASNSTKRRASEYRRLMDGLVIQQPVVTIDVVALQPSKTAVSSKTPSELVCSYNWQRAGGFRVPGHAAVWQDVVLPVKLPSDTNNPDVPKITPRPHSKVQTPFQQVLDATRLMSPDFRFDSVDIVTTRNSLRKFLDLCGGRSLQTFRVNISLVKDTLFIEQHTVRCMSHQGTGWGYGFERKFTRYPPGLEASTAYDRFLRYPIGEMNCVVGFEVDACYEEKRDMDNSNQDPVMDLQAGMAQVSLIPNGTTPDPPGPLGGAKIMAQSTVAELKSAIAGRFKTSLAWHFPLAQLWFGRTPWLIQGLHIDGTFGETRVTNVEGRFEQWEAQHQEELRKLAGLLVQLRESVRGSGGQRCAAVYEKEKKGPHVLKVYRLSKQGAVVSDEVLGRFWGEEQSGHEDEVG